MLSATHGVTTPASLDSSVAAAYPQTLADIASQRHYADNRQQAYASVSVAGDEYVVAAYSNGHVGAVELLQQRSSGILTVVQSIRDHQQGGSPAVTAADLDGDGQPETIVTFDLGPRGGSQTWVYALRAGHLALLSPVDQHGDTVLGLPDVVDFGSGTKELVDRENVGTTRDEPILIYHHYALRGGVFAEVAPLDFYQTFYRAKAAPVTEATTLCISPAALSKPYRLAVVNGSACGRQCSVASGTVSLNGIVVSPPSDFSETRSTWSMPVSLQAQNTITVKLAGKPKGRIALVVRHD
jgi:hypothetical protein